MNRLLAVIFSTALSFACASGISAEDVRDKGNRKLDERDYKGEPVLRVRAQGRAASQLERRLSYREWRLERNKLPWEPNAPGG